jgi:pyrimidine operon attenuation protein/uracil phosphoribosyltransferase
VVDDVINSGRTLIYAVRELLGINLTALKVATLVNRTHRRFPIRADFVGLHISTTLQDNILVEFGAEEIAYLA